ncbi:MAG: cytochrome b5-like heme/steroid binding domain-containing protein [Patescibacteria group bacterium]|nr:cytochrome b5-like heme/steroid binding domain-containing protein [Patescibacteria group bacterium]
MSKRKILVLCSLFFVLCLVSACGAKKSVVVPAPAVKTGIPFLTVAEHNSSTDCWLVVNNNIYNITDHVAPNPDKEAAIAAYCGRDATAVFDADEKNSGQPNFDIDRQTLEQYYIGSLAR